MLPATLVSGYVYKLAKKWVICNVFIEYSKNIALHGERLESLFAQVWQVRDKFDEAGDHAPIDRYARKRKSKTKWEPNPLKI
jgi:hypothetical protein